jgi:hypothetical protein
MRQQGRRRRNGTLGALTILLASLEQAGLAGQVRPEGETTELSSCRSSLTEKSKELGNAELTFVTRGAPHAVFERGDANPNAEGRIKPTLATILPPDVEPTLECRTWACALKLRRGGLAVTGSALVAWRDALLADSRFREGAGGAISVGRGAPEGIYFRAPSPREPSMPHQIFPGTTVEECRRSHAEVTRHLDRVLDAAEDAVPLLHRFPLRGPNTKLTEQLTREVSRILGDPAHAVECRGRICRVSLGADHVNELKRLRRDTWLRSFIRDEVPLSVKGWYYLVVDEAPQTDGSRVLTEWLQRFESSTALKTCGAAHADSAGIVIVRVQLSANGPEIDLSGPLADSALAVCVRKALGAAIASGSSPGPVRPAVKARRYLFPAATPSRPLQF